MLIPEMFSLEGIVYNSCVQTTLAWEGRRNFLHTAAGIDYTTSKLLSMIILNKKKIIECRILWIGREFKDQLIPISLSWTGTLFTRPGLIQPGFEHYEGWGMPKPPWETCSGISPHSQ